MTHFFREWQFHELRSRFERHWTFCKENFPCDPFAGKWIDGEHLPAEVVKICQLATERLHPADKDLGYQCYRRRGTAFDDCCVDRMWLNYYLDKCKAQEPEAHEREQTPD